MDVSALANEVSLAPTTDVSGVWQRHVSARYKSFALDGHKAYGRWGTGSGFPVLYLGRPIESVVVEAYRHLVDPVLMDNRGDNLARHLMPRVLVTCEVNVTNILDLNTATARMSLNLPTETLTSETNDEDAYARCQEVAAVAHQLGLHGLVAPAATLLGETLSLFPQNLPSSERPALIRMDAWDELPPDPRSRPQLRVVREHAD
jgi:hypothetical protein